MALDAASHRPQHPDRESDELVDELIDEQLVDEREDEPEDEEDEEDEGRDDELADEPNEELEVDFAFELGGSRLACIYTRGLWWLGIPELYLSPPPTFQVRTELEWARLATVLASGLIHLAQHLIEADDFDVPPHQCELDGQLVTLWLERQEAPEGRLAIALTSEVDTVLRVDCSLWAEPDAGTDQVNAEATG
jgi:hypothetical protein